MTSESGAEKDTGVTNWREGEGKRDILKGQLHEIFGLSFFQVSTPYGPLIHKEIFEFESCYTGSDTPRNKKNNFKLGDTLSMDLFGLG